MSVVDQTRRLRRQRPLIVTMACSMLAAGGALFAGEVRLSGDKYFTDMSTYDQAISDGIVKNDTAFAAIGVTIHWAMTVVGVFVGAALVVLALLAFFGQSWARAVSWIFGLPVLLWYGGLASLYILGHVLTGDVQAAGPAELDRRFDAAWPSWLNTFDVLLMAAVAVLLIAALVCQTVPAADRYFRKQR